MMIEQTGKLLGYAHVTHMLLAVVYFNHIPCILLGVDHGAEDIPLMMLNDVACRSVAVSWGIAIVLQNTFEIGVMARRHAFYLSWCYHIESLGFVVLSYSVIFGCSLACCYDAPILKADSCHLRFKCTVSGDVFSAPLWLGWRTHDGKWLACFDVIWLQFWHCSIVHMCH